MAKESKLSFDELDMMSIGMVLEHIDLYFEMKRPKDGDKPKVVKATQADINAMLKN
ncbi:hypothetical protein [Lysinibacillus sp. NPDC086135]|uniref:hypothetical protein n=1 Tax=Lysinibacillus sp. NPDC086135 TaxID=3364130 RepID=UPI003816936F